MDPATLLPALISQDNDTRKQAETLFTQLQQTQPDVFFGVLAQHSSTNPDAAIRSLCAVLMRKRMTQPEWEKLSADTKNMVTAQLLHALQAEPDRSVRRKMADCVGEVASAVLYHDSTQWPALIPTLVQMCQNPAVDMREAAMNVFSTLAFSISDQIATLVPTVKPLVAASLGDTSSIDVQVAATKVASSLIQILGGQARPRRELADFLPMIMHVLTAALNSSDELAARGIIEELTNIAELTPAYFKTHVEAMLQVMQQLAVEKRLEDNTRTMAVEFLATLVEKSPVMCRKCPGFVAAVVAIGLHMTVEIEDIDIAEWNQMSDDSDESPDEEEIVEMGKELLDRIACAFRHKDVYNTAFLTPTLVPGFLASGDWKYRQAGLHAISQMSEGCESQMLKDLKGIVGKVLEAFSDPDPRVRWTAINCLGQLETDLGPNLQLTCHQTVLPALAMVMDDIGNPRVVSHAAAAVINFTDKCDRATLEPYLASLIQKMGTLLSHAARHVHEQVITAIAAVADCAGDKFTPHYDAIIPVLRTILVNCTSKEHRKLRGKAIECMSLIAVAVGREKFAPDAADFTSIMLATQNSNLEADDPQIGYLLQAWGRIGKCLQDQFEPFLQHVMPPLLKSAGMEPDEIDLDAEEDGENDDEEEEEEQHVATAMVGDKRVGIRTSALEEKQTACSMIVCYFVDLQDMMYPYVQAVATVMLPLLKYAFSEDIKSSAASLMPELLKCIMGAVAKGVCPPGEATSCLHQVVSSLLECIAHESDLEVLLNLNESLKETIEAAGPNSLTQDQFNAVMECVTVMITEARTHADEHEQQRKEEDFDEDQSERIDEEVERDMSVMDSVNSVICALAKTHKATFIPWFQVHLPTYGAMLTPERNPVERRVGLCIFDDILEQLEGVGVDYMPTIFPIFLQYCGDENAEVRQAAAYGVGVCAQFGGAFFQSKAVEASEAIRKIVQHPNSRDEENAPATDNAISALGKFVEYQSGVIDATAALCMFLSYLPLKGDEEEGKTVNARLATMLERDVRSVLGADLKWLPRIVQIIAEVLETTQCPEELATRFVAILRSMQATLPQETLHQAFGMLSADNKDKIMRFMAR